MKPEERMAMLKELVGFQGQSIDERKRAKALLRSLSQGRDKEIRIHKGDITTSFDKLKIDKRYLPAIGRSVLGSTRSGRRHKTPISTVDFFGPGMSVEDRPFKGGSGDAKSKALTRVNAYTLLSKEEKKSKRKPNASYIINPAINAIVDRATNTGWTSGGHTGIDVPVYSFGKGFEKFRGVQDNTEIADKIFKMLGK